MAASWGKKSFCILAKGAPPLIDWLALATAQSSSFVSLGSVLVLHPASSIALARLKCTVEMGVEIQVKKCECECHFKDTRSILYSQLDQNTW